MSRFERNVERARLRRAYQKFSRNWRMMESVYDRYGSFRNKKPTFEQWMLSQEPPTVPMIAVPEKTPDVDPWAPEEESHRGVETFSVVGDDE